MPLHWRGQYEELLDMLISEGIIKKLEGTTTFVTPLFMVAKAHDPSWGRMIQDFSKGINKCLRRVCTPIPATVASLAEGQPEQQVLLQCRPLRVLLSGSSRRSLTASHVFLNRPWEVHDDSLGHGSQVHQATAFNHKVGDIFDAFPNLRLAWEIDDLLVHCESMAELNKQLELLLKICREHHLTLSPHKLQMCDKNGSLIFAGYKLSSAGCEPDPDRMAAISDFPRPENSKQLQSLFGMIAQFQAWAPDTATATYHMRKLLMDL